MSNRKDDLLAKFADLFMEGQNPFCTENLRENNVTLDECMDTSEMIGLILLGYVNAPAEERKAIMHRGAAIHAGLPMEIANLAIAQLKALYDLERLNAAMEGEDYPK